MCWKNFSIYGVHIPKKCIEPMHCYSYPSPLLKTPCRIFLKFVSAKMERMMMMMMMMMMIMNCLCGMVDRRKAFSLISSRDHCQRSSPSRISDTPWARFEPAQNLGSGLVEWSCAVVITTTPKFLSKFNQKLWRWIGSLVYSHFVWIVSSSSVKLRCSDTSGVALAEGQPIYCIVYTRHP